MYKLDLIPFDFQVFNLLTEKFSFICVSENPLSFSSLLEYDGVYLFRGETVLHSFDT
jgi:hypothetical protein